MQAIQVTADGWIGKFDKPSLTINITCTQAGTWADRATLTFTLTGASPTGRRVGQRHGHPVYFDGTCRST